MMKKRIHYAWVNAVICIIMYFFCSGIAVAGFSVYMPYVREAYHYTNTQMSLMVTVRSLSGFLSQFWVLSLIGKIKIRSTATLACLCVSAAFFLYGESTTLPGFLAGAVLAGLGYGMGSSVTVSVLLHRWFYDKLDIAIGLSASGAGLSSLIWPVVVAGIIEAWNLKTAFFAVAVLAAAGALWVFLFLRDYPGQKGLRPYGAEHDAKRKSGAKSREERRGFRADRSFYVAPLLLGMLALNCNSIYSLYYTECGYDSMSVAYAVSLCGMALLIGKLTYGFISNRIGNKWTSSFFIGCIIFGFAIGCAARQGLWILYLSAIFCGCGVALPSVGMPLWTNEFVPFDEFDRAARRVQVTFSLGGLMFSIIPGMLADLTGSYRIIYVIYVLFSCAVLLIIRRIYWLRDRTK